jgi:magnesium transporter
MAKLNEQKKEEAKGFNLSSITWGRLTWVYIEKPTRAEVEYLAQHFPQFHHLNLEDVLSQIQRPKIDEYEDHLFVVLHFPVFDKQNRVSTPSEVDIFIGENYIVSIHCAGNLKPLTQFFNECQNSEEVRRTYFGHSSSYLLYHILDRLVDYCFPMLNKIGGNIEAMENDVFTKPVPKTVHEILIIKRDLVSFRRIIHPQVAVVDSLEQRKWAFLKGDMDVYFGDIGDHLDKIWDVLEDYRELVDNLSDASNWLTSHNIQERMRIIAVLAALLTPLIVIPGLYGMNLVKLPLGDKTWGFAILLLIMFCFVGIMLFVFRYKRWI